MPNDTEDEILRLKTRLEELERKRNEELVREEQKKSARDEENERKASAAQEEFAAMFRPKTQSLREAPSIMPSEEKPPPVKMPSFSHASDYKPPTASASQVKEEKPPAVAIPTFTQPRAQRSLTLNKGQPRSRRTWSLEIPREPTAERKEAGQRMSREIPNLASSFIRQGSESLSRQGSALSRQGSGRLSRQGSGSGTLSRQGSIISRGGSISRADSLEVELPPPDWAHRFPIRVAQRCSNAHEGEIFSIACSVDGGLMATGGDDRRIRVQALLGTGSPESIQDATMTIKALAFLTPGNEKTPLLCAGTSDGGVRVYKRNEKRSKWDLDRVVPVHGGAVRSLVARTDGEMSLLSASNDRTLALTDPTTGKSLYSAKAPSPVLDAAFMPSATGEIVCAHKDGQIRMYCPRQSSEPESNGNTKPVFEGTRVHSKQAVALSALDDGFGVVSMGRDNTIKLTDTRMNLKVVKEFEQGGLETFSDWQHIYVDQRVLYAGLGHSGRLGVWDTTTGAFSRPLSTRYRPTARNYEDISSRSAAASEVLVPYWTSHGQFVCVHQQKQLSFWSSQKRHSDGTYD